jgi:hypothetical protein
MKSIKDKKEPFTMEDFEKGLMLAGLITPSTDSELHEREEVEEYERSSGKKKDDVFFKRVTLAAEIASQLHKEPTFGRIKFQKIVYLCEFQKIVYLCEYAAEMDLSNRYAKQAAGPFDNKFMHSIEAQFKKNKWFEVEKVKDGKYNRSFYKPMDNVDGYKKYYEGYFRDLDEKIQYVIGLLKKEKTDFTEIVATLFACIIELNKNGLEIDKTNLLERFYNWSEAKARFNDQRVIGAWDWMKEKGLVPNLK